MANYLGASWAPHNNLVDDSDDGGPRSKITKKTKHFIRTEAGDNITELRGDFKYVGGKLASGSVESFIGKLGDDVVFRLTDMEVSITKWFSLDGLDIMKYFFRQDDFISGGRRADLLGGYAGNDEIVGKAGADRLDGGKGDDRLDGGHDDDIMIGGKGRDTYVFSTRLGADNVDEVWGFEAGDRIELSHDVFEALAVGELSENAFTLWHEATTPEHRIIYDDMTGQLFYDENGNQAGGQVLFAVLYTQLSSDDFVVV